MIILQNATNEDVQNFGRRIFNERRDTVESFEDRAQFITEQIYENFRQKDDTSLFALVRLFRLSTFSELPPESKLKDDSDYWFTLAGTMGDEPAWCSRLQSKTRQAVIPSNSPMFQAVLKELHLELGVTEASEMQTGSGMLSQYFYIQDAAQSNIITDQEQFVQPYGIRTVIGFGGVFLSGAVYLMMLFAKDTIARADTEKLLSISPFVATSLASPDGKQKLWR